MRLVDRFVWFGVSPRKQAAIGCPRMLNGVMQEDRAHLFSLLPKAVHSWKPLPASIQRPCLTHKVNNHASEPFQNHINANVFFITRLHCERLPRAGIHGLRNTLLQNEAKTSILVGWELDKRVSIRETACLPYACGVLDVIRHCQHRRIPFKFRSWGKQLAHREMLRLSLTEDSTLLSVNTPEFSARLNLPAELCTGLFLWDYRGSQEGQVQRQIQ